MASFSLYFSDDSDRYTFGYVQALNVSADAVTKTTRLLATPGGFDHYGTGTAPDAIKSVSFTFGLVADTRAEMQAKIDEVFGLYALGVDKLYLQPEGTQNVRWTWARVDNIRVNRRPSEQTDYVQRVSMVMQINPPFWYEDEGSTAISASGTSTDGTVTNDGNANAIPRIVVSCAAGQVMANPTIRRIVSGSTVDEIKYTGTLTASDELIIDCEEKTAELNSTSVIGDISRDAADWFRLAPGENTVRVVSTSGSAAATVTIYHKDTYRG